MSEQYQSDPFKTAENLANFFLALYATDQLEKAKKKTPPLEKKEETVEKKP